MLAALEAAGPVAWLRSSRWGYVAVNGSHILGIALLVGAMVPLNLARLGVVTAVPQETLGRVLVPLAGTGLALAAGTGAVLFATRAHEYAALGVVQLKLALILIGTVTALALHWRYGAQMERATPSRLRLHAAASLILWLVVLALGRTIGFVG